MPCPERNSEIQQSRQMSGEKNKPQLETRNHLSLEKSHKQLLQARTQWVQLYSPSLILFVHLVVFGLVWTKTTPPPN